MSDPSAYPLLPKPGIYRLTSVSNNTTVLEAPDFNPERVRTADWADHPNQHWIVQYSGGGYKIKNRKYGGYMAPPTSKNKLGTVIGISEVPTVWILLRTHGGFAVQYGDEDLAITLHFGMSKANNVVMLWRLADIPDFRRWVCEHISDDTEGETAGTIEDEVQRLRHEPEVKSAQFAEELTKKDQQSAEKDRTIAAITTALYQLGGLGTRCKRGATIRRSGPEDSEQKSNATG